MKFDNKASFSAGKIIVEVGSGEMTISQCFCQKVRTRIPFPNLFGNHDINILYQTGFLV
jgi:hypothetical protein